MLGLVCATLFVSFIFLSKMLLEVVFVHIVYVHVLDVFHEVRFFWRLLRDLRVRLSLDQDGVACTYINFLPKLHLIILLSNLKLRLFHLLQSGLSLSLDCLVLLLRAILISVL